MPASIIAAVVSVVTAVGGAAATAAGALGIGAGVAGAIGTAVEGALIGGGLGALEAGITGGNPLKGLEFGAITGGITGGFSGPLSGLIGKTAADTLLGAAGGALGAEATGMSVTKGALLGGAGGFLTSQLHIGGAGGAAQSTPAATPGGAASSALSTAAPASSAGAGEISVTGAPGGGGGLAIPPVGDPSIGQGFNLSPNAVGGPLPGDLGQGAASGAGGLSFADGAPGSSGGGGVTTGGTGGGGLAAAGGGLSSTVTSAPTGGAAGSFPVGDPSIMAANPSGALASPTVATGAKGFSLGGLAKNPMMDLALGGMALNMLRGNKQPPQFDVLSADAAAYRNQGNQMMSYLQSGTLPGGLQHTLTAAGNAAEATIKSLYAARGMSGSSAEAQDISNERLRLVDQGASMATQLFQQGLNEAGMGDKLYSELLNVQMQQDAELSQSVAGFAQSLALMGSPIYAGAQGG